MNLKIFKRIIIVITFGIILFIFVKYSTFSNNGFLSQFLLFYKSNQDAELNNDDNFFIKLANFAKQRTKEKIRYDPSYFVISYPGGDVPENIGVCTDVIIRSYRKLSIDLQVLVHEDMKKNFYLYPKLWRLLKPDPNIDHRRVPNLMTFFKRKGTALPISKNPSDYKPGDIVTCIMDPKKWTN